MKPPRQERSPSSVAGADSSATTPFRRLAVTQLVGGPGAAITVSFLALGTLYSESGFSLLEAVAATVFVFALPAQVVHAELHAAGAEIFALGLIMIVINARFFPMAISLFPLLRTRHIGIPSQYAASQFMALTSWACFMGTYHRIAPVDRFTYYMILAGGTWVLAILATIAGYELAGELDERAVTTILILNPVYFVCLLLSAVHERTYLVAVILGMTAYPVLEPFAGSYAMLVSGLVGGGGAYLASFRKGWRK